LDDEDYEGDRKTAAKEEVREKPKLSEKKAKKSKWFKSKKVNKEE